MMVCQYGFRAKKLSTGLTMYLLVG